MRITRSESIQKPSWGRAGDLRFHRGPVQPTAPTFRVRKSVANGIRTIQDSGGGKSPVRAREQIQGPFPKNRIERFMVRRIQVIALCAIVVLMLVNCSLHRATQVAPTYRGNVQQTHAVETRLRQPSTAVDVFTKKGLWYFQHPKERSATLRLCDRDFQRARESKSFDKRHYDCDDAIQGQMLTLERNPNLLNIARAKCVSTHYRRIFDSECRAVLLTDQRRKLLHRVTP